MNISLNAGIAIVILILILLYVPIISLYFIFNGRNNNNNSKEKAPIIIYKDQPLPLDIQFGNKNFPSVLYNDLFDGDNTWLGGYQLSNSVNIPRNSKKIMPTS